MQIDSPYRRADRIATHIAENWYMEVMAKAVTVKPPKLFYVLWGLLKRTMSENMREKFTVVMNNEELLEIIDPKFLPVSYGGEMRDTSDPDGIDPESCMRLARPITEKDYWEKGRVWRDLKVSPVPEWTTDDIRPKSAFTLTKLAPRAGVKIGWQFQVDDEITFAILFEDSGEMGFL